ncbi:MAG: TIGR03560 family F420-dependent LLM class oxidoreductase [Candidatus Bathyarchaeota archaeon]|nr:TIGR03560 family F420-dependent LLM class oxidoreductase [Candidatus Bathyarchaeota archaeon]MDH5787186.1 TIGR03560 family F420-dependent LLM class oxidoreductase [Candidatus Bathyarchaeota archaeon]
MRIRFAVHIPAQFGFDYEHAKRVALIAEELSYDLVTIGDHLFLDEQSQDRNCMEAWTLASALAVVTSKIRIGTLVTCNSFRHPGILAKIAATVDNISHGRTLFGIGAGWKKLEYDAYGIPFPPVSERMDQLEEAIQIVKLLWTKPKTTFIGNHYRIKDALCAPKPIQKPHPPILVGGHGKKRTLKIVAKHADMCNMNFEVGPELDELLETLKGHCDAVGRNYNDIEKSFFAYCYITENEEEAESHLIDVAKRSGRTVSELKTDMPGIWVGTPETVRDRCQNLISKGFTSFQIRFLFGKECEMSELFARQVIPELS